MRGAWHFRILELSPTKQTKEVATKAIDVLKTFPAPDSFEGVYYCPEHPEVEIKETVRWTEVPNPNPDARNPVAVHRVVDRWCPVCGRPAVLGARSA
ncbi:hypothetical protein Rm378p043 [Rhodothermus phage RM378]|uniref:hypothetical protein n=1 Tax=Rhodothermus phage RM378 TaxID=148943 RepID=UPI000018F634|nr:hypothetical protein Rm378p043 [Rhodothermus phage RM378]